MPFSRPQLCIVLCQSWQKELQSSVVTCLWVDCCYIIFFTFLRISLWPFSLSVLLTSFLTETQFSQLWMSSSAPSSCSAVKLGETRQDLHRRRLFQRCVVVLPWQFFIYFKQMWWSKGILPEDFLPWPATLCYPQHAAVEVRGAVVCPLPSGSLSAQVWIRGGYIYSRFCIAVHSNDVPV